MSVQKERVIVSDMESEYGKGASKGYAKVYGSTESAKKHEREHLLVRNGLAEKKDKKKAAAAAHASAKKE